MAELRKEDLWVMADKLRNNMDSAEYKHVCLGLIWRKPTRPASTPWT